MRVIGGTARGATLRAPRTKGLRPTSDRVREAMFDVLSSLDVLEGAAVLDLFCGSGALGIEALSRGAASATFVDSDRRCLEAVTANLSSSRLTSSATKLCEKDALGFLSFDTTTYDIGLVDPPYRFERWSDLLSLLRCGLVVLESGRPIETSPAYELHRVYRYGTTFVTVAFSPNSRTGRS